MRAYPTEDERRLQRTAWYRRLRLAGLVIAQHDDPSLGWVATWATGQSAPLPTPEDAAAAAFLSLLSQVQEQHAATPTPDTLPAD